MHFVKVTPRVKSYTTDTLCSSNIGKLQSSIALPMLSQVTPTRDMGRSCVGLCLPLLVAVVKIWNIYCWGYFVTFRRNKELHWSQQTSRQIIRLQSMSSLFEITFIFMFFQSYHDVHKIIHTVHKYKRCKRWWVEWAPLCFFPPHLQSHEFDFMVTQRWSYSGMKQHDVSVPWIPN